MIGGHFWREPPQENESRTMIGLFGERNVCRFEAAVCGEERCVTTLKTAAKETTMDVTSLYTNITQEEGITTVCHAYEAFYIEKPPIPTRYLEKCSV